MSEYVSKLDEATRERQRQDLYRWRAALGLSQRDLGDFLGVGDRTVRRWEEKERDIPVAVLLLMEALVNVPEVRDYFDIGEPTEGVGKAD